MAESNLVEVENQPGKYITEAGKEIKVYKVEGFALYHVAFTSGGELPEVLNTRYTSIKGAENAIKTYLKSKAPVIKTREELRAEGKTFTQAEKVIRKQVRKHGPSADK